ncbi:MAG: hypothetical protein HC799_13285 [Limnothrix sp. RL_2_0]|nr:hypothetical protein [Limnothrix sp. RL_2_0]
MSQRDGFGSGFLLGALFGGIVGGVAGVLAVSRIKGDRLANETEWLEEEEEPLNFNTQENMEVARRSLENKIAQLNGAIDDVRQQMSVIHSTNGQDPSNS